MQEYNAMKTLPIYLPTKTNSFRYIFPKPSPNPRTERKKPVIDPTPIKYMKATSLCRICGQCSFTDMIKIFSPEGRELALEEKILRFLPIAVSPDEKWMPVQVCASCVSKLGICFELWEMCSIADINLRSLLHPKSKHTVQKVPLESKDDDTFSQQHLTDHAYHFANTIQSWGTEQHAESILVKPTFRNEVDQSDQGSDFVVVSMKNTKSPLTTEKTKKSILMKKIQKCILKNSVDKTETVKSVLNKTNPNKAAIILKAPPKSRLKPTLDNTRKRKFLILQPKPSSVIKTNAPVHTKQSRKSNLSQEVKSTNIDSSLLIPEFPDSTESSDSEPVSCEDVSVPENIIFVSPYSAQGETVDYQLQAKDPV